jgi:hypothetical protein
MHVDGMFISLIFQQREFLDWYAQENGIETPREWSKVSRRDLVKAGGQPLLRIYNGSLSRTLCSGYYDNVLYIYY